MEDLTAQSPYDSGYNSEYSTASGPGNPPQNAPDHYPDVSDQADQMIYNAFVATTVTTPDANPPAYPQPATHHNHEPTSEQDTAAFRQQIRNAYSLSIHHGSTTITPYAPFPHYNINTNTPNERALHQLQSLARTNYYIRNHHNLLTTQPASSTSSDDNDDIPPLMDLSDDSEHEDDIPPDTPATPTDDEMNRRRRYATQRTTPIHLPPTTWNTYDIRLATQSSASEHSSDEEAPDQQTSPSYWPIPEDHQPPPPADPSDDQIQAWITSQQPWSTFRHRLPIQQCLAYGHRPPPAITRQDPNRSYMMDISDDSIDPVYLSERIADFRSSSHLTWTSYLNTLSPRIRRAYLDQPPNPADFNPTAISAIHEPDYYNSGTQAPYYEPGSEVCDALSKVDGVDGVVGDVQHV
jgi:hypothetical protein